MQDCIVARVFRETTLFLQSFNPDRNRPEFHWSADRSTAAKLEHTDALDVAVRAYEFDPTQPVPAVIAPDGHVLYTGRSYASRAEARRACANAEDTLRVHSARRIAKGVAETPANYNAPKLLANALVSLTRRIAEGREFPNAHETTCAQWGLTVAQGERLTAMYDAMCAENGS